MNPYRCPKHGVYEPDPVSALCPTCTEDWKTASNEKHPPYGPCDAFMPDASCSECANYNTNSQELAWHFHRLGYRTALTDAIEDAQSDHEWAACADFFVERMENLLKRMEEDKEE